MQTNMSRASIKHPSSSPRRAPVREGSRERASRAASLSLSLSERSHYVRLNNKLHPSTPPPHHPAAHSLVFLSLARRQTNTRRFSLWMTAAVGLKQITTGDLIGRIPFISRVQVSARDAHGAGSAHSIWTGGVSGGGRDLARSRQMLQQLNIRSGNIASAEELHRGDFHPKGRSTV